MTKQALAIHFTLLLSALFSTWLCLKLPHSDQPTKNPNDNKMDSFMSEASYIQADNYGNIQTEVSADTIEHYPNNTSIFKQPRITVYNPEPWRIKADKGTTTQGVEKIHLEGNVTVAQYKTKNAKEPFMIITTNALDIFPMKKIIKTKENVTLRQTGSVIRSTGLNVDMQKETVELLSQSSAHFDAFQAPWVKKH